LPAGAVEALAVVAVLAELATGDPELGEAVVPPDDVVEVEAPDVVVVDELEAEVEVLLLLLPPQAASSVESVPPAITMPPRTLTRFKKRRRDNPPGNDACESCEIWVPSSFMQYLLLRNQSMFRSLLECVVPDPSFVSPDCRLAGRAPFLLTQIKRDDWGTLRDGLMRR